MPKPKPQKIENLKLEKLVNGGQAMGYHEGKPVLVYGALPGEVADIRVVKKRKGIIEGLAENIKLKSSRRIDPKNEYEYLSTSPWQILDWDFENETKLNLLKSTFQHEAGVDLGEIEMRTPKVQYGYRNKMEYNFWGDDDGIHLALHRRGSGQKIKLKGSVLASDAINLAGQDLVTKFNALNIFAGDLKSLILRSNQQGECVAALFVKKEDFVEFEPPESLKGLVCYYSNPKSPASVITKELWRVGSIKLKDSILNQELEYDVNSFFQIGQEMFDVVLEDIKKYLMPGIPLTDFYGGVGSIGISLGGQSKLKIVEIDEHSAAMAKENITRLKLKDAEVEQSSSEEALEYINSNSILVVDPPRAGLHKKVVQRICEVRSPQVIYLSCNPVTQARDLKELVDAGYKIKFSSGYNFFPRTPHIESLVILEI